MTFYVKRANTFTPTPESALDIHNTLPVGSYIVQATPMGELFYEEVDSFTVNFKRYGDNIRHTDRIMDTFVSREVSTGVMLAGEKGSGKSLLAKTLSIKAQELGYPVIIINTPLCGDGFNKFIQDLQQPAVILFDEFEKVYNKDQQESILTLLDGVFPTKKLFVLTCNDKWRIDSHMRNRPGRIYYMIDFKGLSIEFIEEYCQDNLNNKTHIEQICKISALFSQFNFDMLKALVEEMNRYDEGPQEAMALLNAKPEFDSNSENFDVKLQIGGVEVATKDLYRTSWTGNPLLQPTLGFEFCSYEDDKEDGDWIYSNYVQEDLKHIDPIGGKYVYVNKNNEILTLIKEKKSQFDYYAAF
jgi:hypothetical protein